MSDLADALREAWEGTSPEHGESFWEIFANATNTVLRSYGKRIVDVPEGYAVHHINRNPYDNRLSNLAMVRLERDE